jgi:hypothetical protein
MRYKYFIGQKLPKIGDHVFKTNRRGDRVGEGLYIVDYVFNSGIVVGRKLLSNGKSYGKHCCINSYANLKVDDNQLVSTLLESKHDYMKEQEDKNKEKRRICAKVNRHNKKISFDTLLESALVNNLIASLNVGDVIYGARKLSSLKVGKLTLIQKDGKYLKFRYATWGGQISHILGDHISFARFITKEVPVEFKDFKTI